MSFRRIDAATWTRREQFEYYRKRVPTSYTLTTEVDATAVRTTLEACDRKTYIAHIWAIATVVNRHEEFRYTVSAEGEPAVWDVLHPAFTVFNPERETFSGVWAPFDNDFVAFHTTAAKTLLEFRTAETMFPQDDLPPNIFEISTLPWISFTGFTLQIQGAADHLAPIITFGRYRKTEGRTMLPISVQIAHAVADGFHTSRLIHDLEELIADPGWVR